MNRIKGILYELIGRLAAIGTRKRGSGRKLLVIRVDEIGDFMLWHSFLKEIATADAYKGYEFHFCGNQSWKPLFNQFDAEWVSKSFWIDKIRFKKEMGYRYGFLKQVYREGYDLVINPTFSRDKRYDDSIVKAARAKDRIGMAANLESIQPYEIGYDKILYTQLFERSEKPLFEFYRNRFFTEFVTQRSSGISNTQIDQNRLPALPIQVPDQYFVVFPGSRSKARIWPTEHFVQVSNYVFEQYGWTAVVCGTKGDIEYTNAFIKQYNKPVLDLTGKTSLIEMLTVFTQAHCLLSVDTGSVHLAAAVGCTVFGIFNGSQYKRFAPYPKELAANFFAVYPDDVEQELKDESLVKQKYEFVVRVPYASVRAEKVILEVHRHFEKSVVSSQ